jgi:mono/diheme cytochrome c family protein
MGIIKRVFKWIGILLLVILGAGILALMGLYYVSDQKLNKVYDIQVEPIQVTDDPILIERGRHIVVTRGQCLGCHGKDLSGNIVDEGVLVARLVTPNLTSGKGGVGGIYTDEDFVRSIRHGVKKNGKTVVGMPSEYFNRSLNDSDLAAVIAYIRSVPPVDKTYPKTTIGPMGRVFVMQAPFLLAAQAIDHNGPRPPDIQPGVTVEYGEYLAANCSICHGDTYAGGGEAGGGVNLTPGGDMANWTEADFITAIRTGNTPGGHQLDKDLMPWETLGQMTDDELKAIWLYLQTLPPVTSTPTPEK